MSVSTIYDDVVSHVFQPDSPDSEGESHVLTDPYGCEVVDGQGGGKNKENGMVEDGSSGDDELLFAEDVAPCKALAEEVANVESAKKRRRKENNDEFACLLNAGELADKLRRQIEYYFSDKNLQQDEFFHKKISEDADGWLDANIVLDCQKIKQLNITDETDIESALERSHLQTRQRPVAIAVGDESKPTAADGDTTPAQVLQIRRAEALPPLRSSGWLAAQVAEKQKPAQNVNDVSVEPLAVGATVRLESGEFAGQTGQILSIDSGEVTVLVGGTDIAIVGEADLGPC